LQLEAVGRPPDLETTVSPGNSAPAEHSSSPLQPAFLALRRIQRQATAHRNYPVEITAEVVSASIKSLPWDREVETYPFSEGTLVLLVLQPE